MSVDPKSPATQAECPALRVLVVGQSPPPYGGQAIAIAAFVTGRYEHMQVSHVRMGFSDSMSEVGKVHLKKLVHLAGIVPRILWGRLRHRSDVLYYPPAGPDLVPVLRDVVILLCTRWAFRYTVFHFHAGGLSEIYPRLAPPLKALFRRAYGRPDLAIQPSELNPPDGSFLRARRNAVVPGGVPDRLPATGPSEAATRKPVILYVGVLRESKGTLVLIEACRRLRERGIDFDLHLVGQFESVAFERALRQAIATAGLTRSVSFLGVLSGADKDRCYRDATIFCYPTHFESETFGLVLLEAMQFRLPVVASRWRGVPSLVQDDINGFLVSPRDPDELARGLGRLLRDPGLCSRLGDAGRGLYLASYTEQRFRQRLEDELVRLVEQPPTSDLEGT